MAHVLAHNVSKTIPDTTIKMFVRQRLLYEELSKTRSRAAYEILRDIKLPASILLSQSLEDVLTDATHIVFAIPSQYAAAMLAPMRSYLRDDVKVVSLTKGFHLDNDRLCRITTLIEDSLGIATERIATLGGPGIYSEIAQNFRTDVTYVFPCSLVISSISTETAEEFRQLYFTKNIIRAYRGSDVPGAEVAGALKNIYAIACGITDAANNGKGLGVNFKASFITRALYEIAYFARAFGGDREKIFGAAGLGDLLATCQGGRSYTTGTLLGTGLSVDEVQEKMYPNELEGVQTLATLVKYLNQLRRNNPDLVLEMPLAEQIHRVVFDKTPVFDAMTNIFERPASDEMRLDPYLR